MKRVILVNLLILLTFAGIFYWADEKKQVELALAEREEGAAEAKPDVETAGSANVKEDGGQKEEPQEDYIRWVDFGVSKFALSEAYEYDRDTYGTKEHIGWIDLLAYTASMTGGVFDDDQAVCKYMEQMQEKIRRGEDLEKAAEGLEYFPYYQEAYGAVLGGMVGEYEIQVPMEDDGKQKRWEKRYGLKAFSPIAKGFPYADYDDFGVSRSYGYKRNHLGHDMMGQIGTAIIILTRVTLKNNTKISIIENTFFYNLPNQFVLFSVFQIFKIIQKKADLAVYIVDRLFLLFRKAGLTPAGLNICLQLTQFIVQSIDLTENMPG